MKLWRDTAPHRSLRAGSCAADHALSDHSRTQRCTRGHINDLTNALGQQMFFWGRDVLHPGGNLLVRHGFEKSPSPGLKGTSCYRRPWRKGFIELHGACAGWYPLEPSDGPGFLFIRTDRRCYAHHQSQAAVPGKYPYETLISGNVALVGQSGRIFTSWLVEYEGWVAETCGKGHRMECHQMFTRLPAVRPWLPPRQAALWLRMFAEGAELERAAAWKKREPALS